MQLKFSDKNRIFPKIKKYNYNKYNQQLKIICPIKNVTPETIISYVHNLWNHDGNNLPEKSDPISIIQESRTGKDFRCVEYSIVASALLNTYGIPARIINLKTIDCETRHHSAGHVVIEFYNQELKKWIMADVQENIIPICDELPLSSVELSLALQDNKKTNLPIEYEKWIRQYLFYFDTPLELKWYENEKDRRSEKKLFLVPLGARKPKIFQNETPIYGIYTHSLLDFYFEN